MGMSVGGSRGVSEANSQINITPLVDVMLVLLIIFLITIPVVVTSIKLNLPKESNQPRTSKPENIVLSVDKDGDTYWNELHIPDAPALLDVPLVLLDAPLLLYYQFAVLENMLPDLPFHSAADDSAADDFRSGSSHRQTDSAPVRPSRYRRCRAGHCRRADHYSRRAHGHPERRPAVGLRPAAARRSDCRRR